MILDKFGKTAIRDSENKTGFRQNPMQFLYVGGYSLFQAIAHTKTEVKLKK